MEKNNYLSNTEFEESILEYLSNKNDEIENKLVEMFTALINNIYLRFRFKGVEMDDLRQNCLLIAFTKLKSFTPDKGSAFNYFTTVILNEMRYAYTTNKKFYDKIERYIEHLNDIGDLSKIPSTS